MRRPAKISWRVFAIVTILALTGAAYWWMNFPKNIYQAARSGNVAAIRLYLWWSPKLINAPENGNGGSGSRSPPLYQAISAGRLNVVQFLIRRGAKVRCLGFPEAVHRAILCLQPAIARFLVGNGSGEDFFTAAGLADIGFMNRLASRDPALLRARSRHYQRRAISYAIYSGQQRAVEWFLERGFSPNDRSRGRPLIWEAAIGARSLEIVKLLVRDGADPNPKLNGHTSLIKWMEEDPRYVAPSQVPKRFRCRGCREIYLFLRRHARSAKEGLGTR